MTRTALHTASAALWTLLAALLTASCVNIGRDNPYEADCCEISVSLDFGSATTAAAGGIVVKAEDVISTNVFTATSDASGTARFTLPKGMYRFNAGSREGDDIYNGALERTRVTEDVSMKLEMIHSILGPLVIKEIYCGGCRQYSPEGEFLGNYQSDKYIILHNNRSQTLFLDSLCVAVVAPYNSSSSPPFENVKVSGGKNYMDVYAPVIQALWQIGGSGSSFPLAGGEDAVIAFNGAVDHTVQYPLSVNLNKPEYFVCYNSTYFYNERYHPAPGDKIQKERILDCVVKLGQANAYTVSVNSPAFIIFRPEGVSIRNYVAGRDDSGKKIAGDETVISIPGSSVDKVVNVPWEWVTDAVEVFSSMTGRKRINVRADAGYVLLSDTSLGHTLMRKTDAEATAAAGFEVLCDTNNSSEDLYERDKQSLHDQP